MIEWLWPWAFAALPLPWLVRRMLPATRREQAALAVPDVGAFRRSQSSATSGRGSRVPWRLLLLVLGWIALVTAAARPQWTGEPVTLPTSGRDLMLAVDISGSMGTEDMQLGDVLVDRLVVVKRVVAEFVNARQGDRVGLILFGTNAYLQAPLTFDLASVNTLLSEAPVGIAGGKTAIGDAIGLAIKRLRDRPEGDHVLILLTDGANNVGEVAPLKAAELAAAADVKIYTIGVGATELRMPGIFGSLGSRIINPSAELDEETLTRIADLTGGRYFRAHNTAELVGIYALIDEMEPIEQDPETYRPIAALFHWPLGLAWLAITALVLLDYRGARLGAPV
jgi:Ca-activated chloride channel family protein